jgi:hypothetical protein
MGEGAAKLRVTLKAEIVAWLDDYQPGIVRCRFADRFGTEWFVDEKLPVVTAADLWPPFPFPQPAAIAAMLVAEGRDGAGRPVSTIDLSWPYGIETTDGRTTFDVFSEQLSPEEEGR